MPKAKAVKVPTINEVKKIAKINEDEVENSLKLLDDVSIKSQADLEEVVAIAAEAKMKTEQVTEIRDNFVGPLKEHIKFIENFFKPALEGFSTIESRIKGLITEHVDTYAERRVDLLAKVQNEDNEIARSELIKAADHFVVDSVKGMSLREKWDGEVTDTKSLMVWCIDRRSDLLKKAKRVKNDELRQQIEDEADAMLSLMKPDERALKAYTKARKGVTGIAGWRPKHGTTVAITKDKVDRG